MVFHQPKHSLVIKVYFQELMNKFIECRNECMRENRRRIFQSKMHEIVMKTTPLNREGCLSPILRCDFDLMVPIEPISEGICFLATYIVQHFIREWSRERIMYAGVIQLPEIHAYPYFILLLLLLYHHWLTQSDYSTGSMMHVTSILSSSKQTFSLYFGLRQ